MPISFVFSTVACPDWSIEKVATEARAMGYDGVELRTLGEGSTKLASDPALSDPAKIRDIFEASGIRPVCLSTSASLHDRDLGASKATYYEVIKHLELASKIGAPMVRIFGQKVEPNETRSVVLQRIASRVLPLAERAGELGIELLFENAGSFSVAKEWWWLLNLINHPMVGLSWNLATAAAADAAERGGGMAVTMLHSRIKLVKVKDTKIGQGIGFTPLGEGDMNVPLFLKKLRGIGYEGPISVEWDRLWLPSLTPAEEYLPDALARLKKWNGEIDELMAEGRKEAAKVANKKAPKTRAELRTVAAK